MNKLHILATAAMVAIIGFGNIVQAEKRPSVDDINKHIDDENYKADAKVCDKAFKELKADAQAHIDANTQLQDAQKALRQASDKVTELDGELQQSKEALAEQITKSGSLESENKSLKGQASSALGVTNDAENLTEKTTKVNLITSLHKDGKNIPAGTKGVGLSDADLDDLVKGVHYTVDS